MSSKTDDAAELAEAVCDECGDSFVAIYGEVIAPFQAFCPDCWRRMGEDAATADTALSHGFRPGDRFHVRGEDGPALIYYGTNENGDAVLSYGGTVVREVAIDDLVRVE